jgi:transglutaminase-like putative cysteine protease
LAEHVSFRRLVAAAPAVAVVVLAWMRLEAPVAPAAFVAACALALLPAASRERRWGLGLAAAALLVTLAAAFDAPPYRALRDAWGGLRDAPAVEAPFDPAAVQALHGLVVVVAFALALVASLGVAWRRPWVAAAAVAVGVGFPSVLLENAHAIELGLLALAAVLWASLVGGAAGLRRSLPGVVLACTLLAVSAGTALAGLAPGSGKVDWRGWDPFAEGGTSDVRFLWDASYDGIDFPVRPTVMLRIRAPARAEYWRISTLETFTDDRWIEHLYPARVGNPGRLPADPLAPHRDARPGRWLAQDVTIEGLDDTRLPATTEPARVRGQSLGPIEYMQGGVMLARRPLRRGDTYTVWSAAPRPTPRALAASPARYPAAAARYLLLETAPFPAFGAPGRNGAVGRLFRADRNLAIRAYRPLWQRARAVTSDARSPYEATLLLERWFRDTGGFRYEEHPARSTTAPPLVDFVESTRAGYCQHYAGAMALMLRTLGIPARVAVGFTAGTWRAGVWTVTDRQAHAWVEVWFAGYGWLTFDPTPGRGTLSAVYTLASDSADAVRALGTGRFLDVTAGSTSAGGRAVRADPAPPATSRTRWWPVALLLAPLAAALSVVGWKHARRRGRLGRSDPRRLAAGVRAELVGALLDRGADVDLDATSTELGRTAEQVLHLPVASLTDALAEARFGPASRAGAAARQARGDLRRILAAAAAHEAPRVRLRAALSLRSLRLAGGGSR